jgi:hypothetical protein
MGSGEMRLRYTAVAVSRSYTNSRPSLVMTYTKPYLALICIATGKSSANSGGKNSSAFFFSGGVPAGRKAGSITALSLSSCHAHG